MKTNFESLEEFEMMYHHGFKIELPIEESMYECFYIIEQFSCLDELSVEELDRLSNSIKSLKRIFTILLLKK